MMTLAQGLRGIGMPEVLIILVVLILLFGARKIPDLARALGRSLGEFKKGRDEGAKSEDSSPKKDA